MTETSEQRRALEGQAANLGLKYPANIGDEKLQAKIDKALADMTDHGPETMSAEGASQGDPDEAVGVIVHCHTSGGRRRAGQRWDHGATTVPLDEWTDDLRDALAVDPLFTFQAPETE